jgi:deazaflavin-dependent oxidoreductase (nitroreductase family)
MTDPAPSFDRGRPNWWQRLFFKAPIALYRDGPAELMRARCVMLLTTTGRRSGQPRTTGISFMPHDGHYVVFAGWGIRSDWYRNLLANPEVTIKVGRRAMAATAVPVADPARREALMRAMEARSGQCGPPGPIRWLLRRLGIFDYEGDIRLARAQGPALPVVELIPRAAADGGARSF